MFSSDGERNRILFNVLGARARAWHKPKRCSFQGCQNKSIARSHTIQRAGPLAKIAEDSHVLAPHWTPDGIVLKRVGLKDASTFAGFCSSHEAMFDTFEATGLIASEHDLELQIFRSINREIARQTHNLASLKQARGELAAKLNVQVRAEAARLGVEMTGFSYDGGAFGILEDHDATLNASLAWLQGAYADLFPAITGAGASKLVGTAFQINYPLPVALSGLAHFEWDGQPIDALVGVIPQGNGSLLYMTGRRRSESAISEYMAGGQLDLLLIDIVEAWMVRGNDHWFITPSVWEAIPILRRDVLVGEMRETSLDVRYPPTTSIFDTQRRTALDAQEAPGLEPSLKEYVAMQRLKLSGVIHTPAQMPRLREAS